MHWSALILSHIFEVRDHTTDRKVTNQLVQIVSAQMGKHSTGSGTTRLE